MFRVLSCFLCLFLSLSPIAHAETSATNTTKSSTTSTHKNITPKHTTAEKTKHTTTKNQQHHVVNKSTHHKAATHKTTAHKGAITEVIDISDLREFESSSPEVKDLIEKARHLSSMHLTYMYGSANPKNGGMDCSGTMYYLLNQTALRGILPRQSDQIFDWMERQDKIHPVAATSLDSPEFDKLKPGDLLFWSGTYVSHHESPITHVMLYLGTNKRGQRLMFGSSDGRSYGGKRIRGVSVFDFRLPSGRGTTRFVGYGCIPGLTCE